MANEIEYSHLMSLNYTLSNYDLNQRSLNYLKGRHLFANSAVYYAIYNDATGLNTASEIMLNGVTVGKVRRVEMLHDQDYKILATLEIDKNIKLTNTTAAHLVSNSLLGNKVIDLLLKEGTLLHCHDTLVSSMEQDLRTLFTDSTLPAINDAKAITNLTNQFVKNLVENIDRINTIFCNLEKTSQELRSAMRDSRQNVSTISKNMAEISGTLSDSEVGIRPLLTSLKKLTHDIEAANISSLTCRANNILSKLEDGKLHGHLDQAIVNLDRLLVDFRKHPSKYVHFSLWGGNSIFSNHRPQKKCPPLPIHPLMNLLYGCFPKTIHLRPLAILLAITLKDNYNQRQAPRKKSPM
eukprot:gene209-275_t